MGKYDELAPEEHLDPEEEEAILHRLRLEGVRRQSRTHNEPARPRWRLLLGLTCGHRYWLRRDRWRYPAVLPHLYCPQCDVIQPVNLASRRKVRRRMTLPTTDLRGLRDQPPKPPRLGQEPRQQDGMHVLEVATRELGPASKVERMKTPRGLTVQLACGHSVRLKPEGVRIAVDPGQLTCPNGDGNQAVSPDSVVKAKARLGI